MTEFCFPTRCIQWLQTNLQRKIQSFEILDFLLHLGLLTPHLSNYSCEAEKKMRIEFPNCSCTLAMSPLVCIFSALITLFLTNLNASPPLHHFPRTFSSLGTRIPEKFYFVPGLFITAVIALINYSLWFAVLKDAAGYLPAHSSPSVSVQRFSEITAYISCVTLSLIASFQADRMPELHNTLKFVFLLTFVLHMLLNLSGRWAELGSRPKVFIIELILTVWIWCTFISVVSLYFVSRNSIFYHPPNSNPTETAYLKTVQLFESLFASAVLLQMLVMITDMKNYRLRPWKINGCLVFEAIQLIRSILRLKISQMEHDLAVNGTKSPASSAQIILTKLTIHVDRPNSCPPPLLGKISSLTYSGSTRGGI
ncbi:unnamed protein product [Calicophoron daubneyi]|uniref:CWH43-like N-terminal domain-containing protein n=1 Tax=Calicophoron daubneyi TaxID=300641 RepID=A0AAV2TXX2_CALDB